MYSTISNQLHCVEFFFTFQSRSAGQKYLWFNGTPKPPNSIHNIVPLLSLFNSLNRAQEVRSSSFHSETDSTDWEVSWFYPVLHWKISNYATLFSFYLFPNSLFSKNL